MKQNKQNPEIVNIANSTYRALALWVRSQRNPARKLIIFSDGGYPLYSLLKNEKNVYYVDIPKEERNPLSENAIIKLNELNYFSEETDAFLVDLHALFAATLYDYGTEKNPLFLSRFFFPGVVANDSEDVRTLKNLRGKPYETLFFDIHYGYAIQTDISFLPEIHNAIFSDSHDFSDSVTIPNDSDSQALSGDSSHNALPFDLNPKALREELEQATISFASFLHTKRYEKDKKKSSQNEITFSISEYENYSLHCKNTEKGFPEEELSRERRHHFSYEPSFSVVVPVYNTESRQLRAAIDSVCDQTYANYELILVDDKSTLPSVREDLKLYEGNPHVKIHYRKTNGNISEATNTGIDMATGEFIVFMDCDDTLSPDALYRVAEKLNENPNYDFIYSDSDKLTEDGRYRHNPYYKPDWSRELFISQMYTCHLSIYRAELVRKTGGLRTPYNGSQDYDFTLRFLNHTTDDKIGHINRILYHWRERKESVASSIDAKRYALVAAKKTKEDYFREMGTNAYLSYQTDSFQYLAVYDTGGDPLVSIVILTKNHPELLRSAVSSIERITAYSHYEIIIVDNGSDEKNRAENEAISRMNFTKSREIPKKYFYNDIEFNYSLLCNFGAEKASGEYLLFLNDDTECIVSYWLSRMVGEAREKNVGAVGAKLFYTDSVRLQHAGIYLSSDGEMVHSLAGGYNMVCYAEAYPWLNHECLAVTGACLLIKKEIFDSVGGFDEELPVAYNDVDLCLTLLEKGYRNIIRADAVLYHHESLSRGEDRLNDARDKERLFAKNRLSLKHPLYTVKDPYRNENLEGYTLELRFTEGYKKAYRFPQGRTKEVIVSRVRKTFSRFAIDVLNDQDEIYLAGWSHISLFKDNTNAKRYIILEDPFGNRFALPVSNVLRPDLQKKYKLKHYLNAGFGVHCPFSLIPADFIPFKISLCTYLNGKRYIQYSDRVFTGNRFLRRTAEAGLIKVNESEEVDFTVPSNTETKIESQEEKEEMYIIRGYAITDGEENYRYKTELLLRFKNGDTYRAKVTEEDRPDIQANYPNKKYLRNIGFTAYIPKKGIPEGPFDTEIIRTERVTEIIPEESD